jgi:hypothetical protein
MKAWNWRRLEASDDRHPEGGEPGSREPATRWSDWHRSAGPRPEKSRSRRKKILTPIVLALIGGTLILVAIALYPSSNEPSVPSYATIGMSSSFKIGKIEYYVSQVSPSVTEVFVRIVQPIGVRPPPAKASTHSIALFLPPGIAFRTCPEGFCFRQRNQYYWKEELKFRPVSSGMPSSTGMAFANFFVRAHGFGYASNDVTALAAIPQVFYDGPGSPTLTTAYENASSASSYDWSAFPTESINGTEAVWDEPVASGGAQGRVAVGINHANQTKDNNMTFLAGALIGLAGGALLSAVQEALHANG